VKGWDDQPITAEIFGIERARQHARTLAAAQATTASPPRVRSIVSRLEENAKVLQAAYLEMTAYVASGKTVSPAAEWFIDNYHQVEEQIRQVRADLPPGFYRQLPKLAEGPLSGHPRIFGVVWAHVAHTDSHFDPHLLTDFINEYQSVQPLTIGELWAVAISLRLILIENLRRIIERILAARIRRQKADVLADKILAPATNESELFSAFTQAAADKSGGPFAVQLLLRLRDQDGKADQVITWLRTAVAREGSTLDKEVDAEHQRQGAANVTVRNIITSMRMVADVSWENWFDSVSLVDHELRERSAYGEMDFASRTLYRNAIEDLARGSARGELDVTRLVLSKCAENPPTERANDPGWHLISGGRAELEKTLGFNAPRLDRMRSAIKRMGLAGYTGAVVIVTLTIWAALLYVLDANGWVLLLLAVASLLPATEAALGFVNYVLSRLMHAAVLPGLAFRDGVPAKFKTLVVVPTLLSNLDEVEEMIQRLEVHYLSNAEGETYFALLSDFTDANTETTDNDKPLLDLAVTGIDRLNGLYTNAPFILLHRPRLWNAGEGKWMGWERKRGKLHEMNQLILGETPKSIFVAAGTLPVDITFVLTLDADTRLPRDAARRLAGKLAHPLVRPHFDQELGRVTSGHAILQPRVTPSLPIGHVGSLYQRIYSTTRGIDPYVFAVSDIYQDIFDEGSFTGKGIYDVRAFEAALAGKVPENSLLSHDLFEGVFARSAFVADIEVVEEHPERYAVGASRQHRWARGDWQLLPWLQNWAFPKHETGRIQIPALGRWKMYDNLRRSMVPGFLLSALILGWLLLGFGDAARWTLALVFLSMLTPVGPVLLSAIGKRSSGTVSSGMRAFFEDIVRALTLGASNLLYLAHHAAQMLDAALRTFYRLWVSRYHMLEWTTAAQAGAAGTSLSAYYKRMWASPAFGLAVVGVLFLKPPAIIVITLPFTLAWLAAPWAAKLMSKSPELAPSEVLTEQGEAELRTAARRTWRFFERYVNAQESHLPPDNFQETPQPVIAHRTSPTNIGLYLLSIVSAREFGWIGLADALQRLEDTLATIGRMEKYKGHLFNWYDTQDLRALDPRYVSTVDSGNLAGHFIALANACEDWSIAPAAYDLSGMFDVIGIIATDLNKPGDDRRKLRPVRKQFEEQLRALEKLAHDSASKPELMQVRLIELSVQAANLENTAQRFELEFGNPQGLELKAWVGALRSTIESQFKDSVLDGAMWQTLRARLATCAATCRKLAFETEFGFLLDPQRLLLSIGYRVPEGMRDESCYDLLASEARLASFFAVAKGDLRTRHWFRLGRTVTAVDGGAALISWSGSMFEYLMPSIVMRAPTGGLLDTTTKLIVRRQIDYAARLSVPWGISESSFNARDVEFTYQYSNFGVPGLGLKRGLADNLVIAPYATGLASMIAPASAAQNFRQLESIGALGAYGFYEAIDYTRQRLPQGDSRAIVRAYFAHHQGMTITAIFNTLKQARLRELFHREPIVHAAELLLQERSSRTIPQTLARAPETGVSHSPDTYAPAERTFTLPLPETPVTHVMSNGHYTTMLTSSGGGYSAWNGLQLTRWREDSVCDDWGSYVLLRDVRSGAAWPATLMPSQSKPVEYSVSYSEDRAAFTRRDALFTTRTECVVSTESDGESRRITITNNTRHAREVELTSFMELALAPMASDIAHPAFSKMFVKTEYVPEHEALIATRRRRTPQEPQVWLAHFCVADGGYEAAPEYETDRRRFVGRGRDRRSPDGWLSGRPLSGRTGFVLDPVFAMRRTLRVPAYRKVRCDFWLVAASSREAVLDLVDRHRQAAAHERAVTLAWTQSQIRLRHLGLTQGDAHLFQNLSRHLIYASSAFRPPSRTLENDLASQTALWPMSISGDNPILLVRIDDIDHLELVAQLLKAFEYWKTKRLKIDLVILNERSASYQQDLQNAIDALVRKHAMNTSPDLAAQLGKVFTLRAEFVPPQSIKVLAAAARVVLVARRGDLASQLSRINERQAVSETVAPTRLPSRAVPALPASTAPKLQFDNGHGGFSEDGREYVISPRADRPTPAPWINVVANAQFGFQCSAEGGGYMWFGNSRDHQLTPWNNDAVCDPPAEAIFVRDEETGALYSPTLKPLNQREGTYQARHGFGYSTFKRDAADLKLEFTQTVPLDATYKLMRLQLTNRSKTTRKFSVTWYAEPVLGPNRSSTARNLVTSLDADTGALFVRNPWTTAPLSAVMFADMSGRQTSWTGDRLEFLGARGALAAPAVLLSKSKLSNRTGAGMDPCLALSTEVSIGSGQTEEILIIAGAAAHADAARKAIREARDASFDAVMDEVSAFWGKTLGGIKVNTPETSFDIMMNGWLLYQTLSCRIWARSGFYQASGAFGFRDQLQDCLAFLPTKPELARAQIIRAAGRQFVEGDFQHWWLPETGAGVRTRISDDFVWLAYCLSAYVRATGDVAVVQENIPFLEGQTLVSGEHDVFFAPQNSAETGTLYEHAARAIDRAVSMGRNGLPLIGTGDWNDGMNRVGEGGKGESVWLGWFLLATLRDFLPIAEKRKDAARIKRWKKCQTDLIAAVEKNAWDGSWYRRAFYDDGTPLGSAKSDECRIDAIAQSWAVLSGAADPGRARQAMEQSLEQLVRKDQSVALLFTPPFDTTEHDPGYIKSYPPGVRENGGQYTHGAIWSIFALAELGEAEKAYDLFSMINPINHARNLGEAERYRVEPYAVAADVYSVEPYAGMGGWTWYTGSAGWFYRAGLEAILGFRNEGDLVKIRPSIPAAWDECDIVYKFGAATYELHLTRVKGTGRGDGERVKRAECGAFEIPLNITGGSRRFILEL
jgi:cyclic beta-1,2-glucan synthetase